MAYFGSEGLATLAAAVAAGTGSLDKPRKQVGAVGASSASGHRQVARSLVDAILCSFVVAVAAAEQLNSFFIETK